jgi:signal transduction histidine kinase/ligand-binding sensor domain-containing protein/DNA-binding response OmpR family regulator
MRFLRPWNSKNIFRWIFLAWLIGVWGFYFPALGQQNRIKFKTLSSKDGLSSSMAWSLAQDHRGFMWIGTYDGLNVYNGYEFKTYRHEPDNPHSLSHNFVSSLLVDQQQRLWVGTPQGLNLYDAEKDQFTRITPSGNPETVSPNVLWIYEDPHHTIWAGTSDGMNFLNEVTGQFERPAMLDRMRISSPVTALLQDKTGRYWLGTEGGVYAYQPQTGHFTLFRHDPAQPLSLTHDNVYALLEDSRGNIWIGSSGGLDLFLPEQGGFRNFRNDTEFSNASIFSEIRSIVESTDGNLWLGTYDGGLKKFDLSSHTFTSFRRDPKDQHSLADNSVKKILQDEQGGVWVATFRGVSYTDLYQMQFEHVEHKTYDPGSLTDNFVTALFQDSQGALWVGNRYGISQYHPQADRFTHYLHSPTDPASISDGAILAITEDPDGNFWCVTHTWSLNRFDRQKKVFHHYNVNVKDRSLLKDKINFVLSTQDGNVWVSFTKGISRYDKATDSFTNFPIPDSLYKGSISLLFEDSHRNLWAVSRGTIYLFDREKNQFSRPRIIPESLPAFQITDVYEDKKNNLWIGSIYNGLVAYNLNTKQARAFTAPNDLPNLFIKGIQEDQKGNIWLSSSTGLCQFNPATKEYTMYGLADGLKNSEFNQGVYLVAPDGKMWFGGHNGISVFFPDQLRKNPNVPKVAITNFQLFNKSVPVGPNSPLKKSITETTHLDLDYTQSVLSFEFVGLNYNAPEKNQYAYRMLGFEDDWNYSGTRRHVTYTNLPPGKTYTFQVKASNNDGVWNEEGTSLQIYIAPPFWATWWFYSLLALFTVCSLYALYRWRTRQHFHQRRELERMVKARTEEVEAQKTALAAHADHLKDANREIRLKNSKIQGQANKLQALDRLKSQFLANISHEFRTPLTLILVPLEEMLSAARAEGDTKQQLTVMNRNAKRLLQLINQLLDLSKLENGRIPLTQTQKDVVSFTKSVSDSFASLAQKHRIHLAFSSSREAIVASFDADKLEKILYNLLSNAFKFTPEGGHIRVSLQPLELTESGPHEGKVTQQHYLQLSVSDTGTGISPEHLPHIFDRFYQGDPSSVRKSDGTGIGLALTKELVELHGGRISVTSAPGQGTCFTVLLPLAEADPAAPGLPAGEAPQAEAPAEQEQEAAPQPQPEPGPALTSQAPLLLIVEDNPDLRQQIRRIFAQQFRVEEAADGLEGWQKASDLTPDLILSDVMMPGKDGLALCHQLKNDPGTSHIPTILLSARIDGEEAGLRIGADDYITKPFNARALELKVRNLLDTRQRLREAICRELGVQAEAAAPAPTGVTPPDKHFLQQASDIVLQHLANSDFDTEIFYRELGMSRSLVYKKLKSLTGLGPNEFIRQIRLNKASQLLLQGQHSVSDVMFEVGIQHRSYFIKCFRHTFGHLPSEHLALQEAQPAGV